MSAGYSGTPLDKKLGLKANIPVLALCMPVDVRRLIETGVKGISWLTQANEVEAAILFATRVADLEICLARTRAVLRSTGFIWVSWPKKSSGVETDITEHRIRTVAFSLKLVDVKVCAITHIWSGLKLVIRLQDRV